MSKPSLQSILSYPIKGFPVMELGQTMLEAGSGIPNDRRYAFTLGTAPTGERLHTSELYRCSLHDGLLDFALRGMETGLELTNPAGDAVCIRYDDAGTIEAANCALSAFLEKIKPAPQGIPQLAEANTAIRHWDFSDTPISLINAASVGQIADTLNMSNDPSRFRCNLVIGDMEPWEELAWVGKRIKIGEAEIDISRPVQRCPAPGVNPLTGERDIDFAQQMPEAFGHAYCGLYGVVVKGGTIQTSDEFEIVGDAAMTLETASAESEPYPIWARFVDIADCNRAEDKTLYKLQAGSRWPLAPAKADQRLRICMAPNEWTAAYIVDTANDHYVIEVEKSATSDPVTEALRTGYDVGDRLITCGPFGRV